MILWITCFGSVYFHQDQMKTAEYQVVTASLSNDFKEAVAFNLRKHKARIQINLIGL